MLDAYEIGIWDDYNTRTYMNLLVSLNWCKKHCVTHTFLFDLLKDKIEKLEKSIEGNFLLYDWIDDCRFTMRYDVCGVLKEENNCIISRELFPKGLPSLGFIFKYKGFYLRIVETFDLINKKLGSFIAEAISLENLINMKKGEN